MPRGRGQLKVYNLHVREQLQLSQTTFHEVVIDDIPFASGGCREAFYCRIKDENGQWGPQMVAKRYLRSEAFLEDYICAHYAHECACAFNQSQPPKPVDYLIPNQILTLHNQSFSIERFLSGEWQKHNNIFGMVLSDRRTPNAFSHFTYLYSRRRYIILDVQGVGETFTDPAVVSVEQGRFGYTDTGLKGIRDFFKNHVCNDVCHAMGLKPIIGHIADDVPWETVPRPLTSAKVGLLPSKEVEFTPPGMVLAVVQTPKPTSIATLSSSLPVNTCASRAAVHLSAMADNNMPSTTPLSQSTILSSRAAFISPPKRAATSPPKRTLTSPLRNAPSTSPSRRSSSPKPVPRMVYVPIPISKLSNAPSSSAGKRHMGESAVIPLASSSHAMQSAMPQSMTKEVASTPKNTTTSSRASIGSTSVVSLPYSTSVGSVSIPSTVAGPDSEGPHESNTDDVIGPPSWRQIDALWAMNMVDLRALLVEASIPYGLSDDRKTLIWKYLAPVYEVYQGQVQLYLEVLDRAEKSEAAAKAVADVESRSSPSESNGVSSVGYSSGYGSGRSHSSVEANTPAASGWKSIAHELSPHSPNDPSERPAEYGIQKRWKEANHDAEGGAEAFAVRPKVESPQIDLSKLQDKKGADHQERTKMESPSSDLLPHCTPSHTHLEQPKVQDTSPHQDPTTGPKKLTDGIAEEIDAKNDEDWLNKEYPNVYGGIDMLTGKRVSMTAIEGDSARDYGKGTGYEQTRYQLGQRHGSTDSDLHVPYNARVKLSNTGNRRPLGDASAKVNEHDTRGHGPTGKGHPQQFLGYQRAGGEDPNWPSGAAKHFSADPSHGNTAAKPALKEWPDSPNRAVHYAVFGRKNSQDDSGYDHIAMPPDNSCAGNACSVEIPDDLDSSPYRLSDPFQSPSSWPPEEEVSGLSVKQLRARLYCAGIEFSETLDKEGLEAKLRQHLRDAAKSGTPDRNVDSHTTPAVRHSTYDQVQELLRRADEQLSFPFSRSVSLPASMMSERTPFPGMPSTPGPPAPRRHSQELPPGVPSPQKAPVPNNNRIFLKRDQLEKHARPADRMSAEFHSADRLAIGIPSSASPQSRGLSITVANVVPPVRNSGPAKGPADWPSGPRHPPTAPSTPDRVAARPKPIGSYPGMAPVGPGNGRLVPGAAKSSPRTVVPVVHKNIVDASPHSTDQEDQQDADDSSSVERDISSPVTPSGLVPPPVDIDSHMTCKVREQWGILKDIPRTMFLKYGKKGSPHRRYFTVEPRWDGKKFDIVLVWQDTCDQEAHGEVVLDELETLEVSTNAKRFQRHLLDNNKIMGRKGQVHDSTLCFTLQFMKRSLDLLALSRHEFDLWTLRMKGVVAANKNTDPTTFFVTI